MSYGTIADTGGGCKRVGLSRTSIFNMVRDGTFPATVRISPRKIYWPESVINKHIEWLKKMAARETKSRKG